MEELMSNRQYAVLFALLLGATAIVPPPVFAAEPATTLKPDTAER
jgi:hypothetical protein